MYKFRPPTVKEGPLGPGRLFSFYGLDRGVSVFSSGGEWYETRYPTEDEIAEADNFYRGGYIHEVDDLIGAELLALGYDVSPI